MPELSPSALPYRSAFGATSRLHFLGYTESEEFPTRDIERAKVLIEMIGGCPEVGAALETICSYALSSGTGDELGFAVAQDDNNPRPEQVAIAQAVLERCCDIFGYWQIIWRFLAWGDAFANCLVDLNARRVERLLLLPTWQLFVIPDPITAVPIRYEQRVSRQRVVGIDPIIMVHWAYNKRYLYGRSLFEESLDDWQRLKRANEALTDGAETITYQPNLHLMPPGADESYKAQYKADHESRKRDGIIPDIYLLPGQDVRKPQGLPSAYPLNGFIDNFNLRRTRIAARSRVPPYLLGIDTKFAREIAMQPAIGFKVFVGVVRQLFAAGLRRIIDLELALQGIPPPWHYKILFPELNINPFQELPLESDIERPGVSDVEESESFNGRTANFYSEVSRG